jgi:precorrin-4/cobalt-precorrin-4 C11-methyltransferase
LEVWSIQQCCLELPYRASYGIDCPAIVLYRASRPEELPIRGTLGDIRDKLKKARITRTALVVVGPALAGERATESRLYAAVHHHSMRPRR